MDKISKEELLSLKLLKSNIEKSQLNIELATSHYNNDVLNHKYYLLYLYRKYAMDDTDKISEDTGEIDKIKGELNDK